MNTYHPSKNKLYHVGQKGVYINPNGFGSKLVMEEEEEEEFSVT